MELNSYFKSVIEQDRSSVVICDLNHKIIYMNPSAISRYAKRGGASLVGKILLDCHNDASSELIKKTVLWFEKSADNNIVYTCHVAKENMDVYMVALRDENKHLIGYYEKHEHRDKETAEPYAFD